MAGFFQTNNQTPWATPGVPAGNPFGGFNWVNSKPATTLPGAAPAAVTPLSGTPTAPAPAPSTPAPAVQQAPAASTAPVAPPTASTNPPGFDWVNGGTPAVPPAGGTPLNPTGAPNDPASYADPNKAGSGAGIPSLQDLLAAIGGTGSVNGLFTSSDTFGLPGKSVAGENLMQLLAQMLTQQAQTQQGRGAQAESIYQGQAQQGPQSAPYGLAMDAATQARNRISPDALNAYESQLRTRAASDAGQGYQNSMQRLRDAGMFGRGDMGIDPALAASNLANSDLSRRNLDISGQMETLNQNRLAQAGQLSQSGANVYQNLGMIPQLNYAQQLQTDPNSAMAQLQNFLSQMGQMAVTGNVAQQNAPNAFQKTVMPLLGGVLGAAGQVGGGLATQAPTYNYNY